MLIVAGLSLKNLHPRVWDPASPHHLSNLRAVMVSYADFHRWPAARQAASEQGLHTWLGVPAHVKIYLDNGSFYFRGRRGQAMALAGAFEDYDSFVAQAKPDWWPIPRDFIPTPTMPIEQQWECLTRTMEVNQAYWHDGFVPVVHIGAHIEQYVRELLLNEIAGRKRQVALGGIVPNLLRAPKAIGYDALLGHLLHARGALAGKQLHVFGIGGTATLHLASIIGIDSADSSGWRNRAARGIIQMPGSGDRVVAELGSWRGRRPTSEEWSVMEECPCPACATAGVEGIKAGGLAGFAHRATHNLWVVLEEARWAETHLADGTYNNSYRERLNNSTYLPLIDQVLSRGSMTNAPDPSHIA